MTQARENLLKSFAVIGGAALIALLLVGVWYFRVNQGAAPDQTKWQAVFLNNGQVYFGHIRSWRRGDLELVNVYYLRASQGIQPANSAAPSFELVKLGGEIHGPEDAIHFGKSAILFWEDMKADSQVSQAISNFQNNTKK